MGKTDHETKKTAGQVVSAMGEGMSRAPGVRTSSKRELWRVGRQQAEKETTGKRTEGQEPRCPEAQWHKRTCHV